MSMRVLFHIAFPPVMAVLFDGAMLARRATRAHRAHPQSTAPVFGRIPYALALSQRVELVVAATVKGGSAHDGAHDRNPRGLEEGPGRAREARGRAGAEERRGEAQAARAP